MQLTLASAVALTTAPLVTAVQITTGTLQLDSGILLVQMDQQVPGTPPLVVQLDPTTLATVQGLVAGALQQQTNVAVTGPTAGALVVSGNATLKL